MSNPQSPAHRYSKLKGEIWVQKKLIDYHTVCLGFSGAAVLPLLLCLYGSTSSTAPLWLRTLCVPFFAMSCLSLLGMVFQHFRSFTDARHQYRKLRVLAVTYRLRGSFP